MSGSLTIGELTAFFSYIWYLVNPLQQLGYQINNLTQSIASGQRILEILDTPRGIRDSRDAVEIGRIEGHVKFDHVTFTYEGGGEPALRDISLDVPAGSVVGIFGPTGAGRAPWSV